MTRCAFCLAVALSATVASAAPDCLVVQIKVPMVGDKDPNFSVGPFLAEALAEEGRVRPVLWSLTDPVFREWTSKDGFGEFLTAPTEREALDRARRLGVGRVVTLYAQRTPDQCEAIIEYFFEGRRVWRYGPKKLSEIAAQISPTTPLDPRQVRRMRQSVPIGVPTEGSFTVYKDGVIDLIETARSLASTWTKLLAAGPLSKLAPRPTPTTDLGSADPHPIESWPTVDPASVLSEVSSLKEKGRYMHAVSLLRRATDKSPFDFSIRRELALTLVDAGYYQEAGKAASAASKLEPQNSEIWLVCAKAWILACEASKAQDALDQALVRGGSGPITIEIAGDIDLLNGKLDSALFRYLSAGPSATSFRKALTQALLGDEAETKETLSKLGSRALSNTDYAACVAIAGQAMHRFAEQARSVLPEIRLHPGDAQTLELAAKTAKFSSSLSAFWAALVPPADHVASHEARKLAHILLAQACLEAQEFARNNDPDLAEESAATLGQGLKILSAAEEKFLLERRYSQ
ncbi:MAG: hypothetical protein JNM34_05395 [Chthonomonadaceae bacterium]|nr:hypothetical protein [Chthonomonadaceae bacterium]